EERVTVLWGPEDLSAFPYAAPPPGTPFTVGYLGNGNYWQGIETLARAARLVEHEGIRFHLAGFAPTVEHGFGGGNVVVPGPVRRADVPAVLSRCHVLVSPRIGDRATAGQYPQKLSTYLAAGRPVIASDVNDQAAVLALAECGLVVPPGDARALAAAIVRMRDLP